MRPEDVFINVHYDNDCDVTYFEKVNSQSFTDTIPQDVWDLYEESINRIERLMYKE